MYNDKAGATKKVKNGDNETPSSQIKKEKKPNLPTIAKPSQDKSSKLSPQTIGDNAPLTPNQKISVASRVKQVFFRDQDSPAILAGSSEHSSRNSSPSQAGKQGTHTSSNEIHDQRSSPYNEPDSSSPKVRINVNQNVIQEFEEKAFHTLPHDRSSKSSKHAPAVDFSNPKEKRAKSPRFTLIDRLRHLSGGASVSTSDLTFVPPRHGPVPPADPSVLPEVSPDGFQLHFASHSLKKCKEPHKLCEHHGSENLQMNKKLVATIRSQLSHSLTTSATNLLRNMPPPSDMSNRLEQVLTMEITSANAKKIQSGNVSPQSGYSQNNTASVRRIAESDKYVMLARNPPHLSDSTNDVVSSSGKQGKNSALLQFFCNSTCYDLMPDNSRLIAVDTRLSIGKSFRALLSNGIRAAPMWDSKKCTFVGMLTLTDFIHILLDYYRISSTDNALVSSPRPLESTEDPDLMLEKGSIEFWLRKIHGTNYDKCMIMHSLAPGQSLLTALRVLRQHRIHRLPVMNPLTGNLHFIITHKRLLAYLHMRFHALQQSPHTIWRITLEESGIGTYEDILCATENERMIDVLHAMLQRNVSAVPVVKSHDSRTLLYVFSKFDFVYVASTLSYKCRDTTIAEALELRRKALSQSCDCLYTCLKSQTLLEVMEKLVHSEVHRLIVVDCVKAMTILGIVTVTDLLSGFMLSPRRSSAPETALSE